jgi:hypothetical protein
MSVARSPRSAPKSSRRAPVVARREAGEEEAVASAGRCAPAPRWPPTVRDDLDAHPAACAAAHQPLPGSEIPGVPASEISATRAPPASALDQLVGARASLPSKSDITRAPPACPGAQQLTGAARVLGGDDLGLAQHARGAQREILEVADRRGDDRQRPPRHYSSRRRADVDRGAQLGLEVAAQRSSSRFSSWRARSRLMPNWSPISCSVRARR